MGPGLLATKNTKSHKENVPCEINSTMDKPTIADFDPWKGSLDAIAAWEEFGGLDVDDAFNKFCTCPEQYAGDFMWMGPKAFVFYLPVLEKHIQRAKERESIRDEPASVEEIGQSILFQLQSNATQIITCIDDQLARLCEMVLQNPRLYCDDPDSTDDQERLYTTWNAIHRQIHTPI